MLINIRSCDDSYYQGRGLYLNNYFENRQQNTRMSRICSFLSSLVSSASSRGCSGVDQKGGGEMVGGGLLIHGHSLFHGLSNR